MLKRQVEINMVEKSHEFFSRKLQYLHKQTCLLNSTLDMAIDIDIMLGESVGKLISEVHDHY